MKQIYFLVLAATLAGTTSLATAQSKPATSRPVDRLFKRTNPTTKAVGPQGRPQAKSVAGTVVEHQWDSDLKVWSSGVKTVFQYNDRGQVLEAVRTDTTSNQPMDKMVYTVSAAGYVTQRLTQLYDEATKTFLNDSRELISYNAAGLDTLRLEQLYDSKGAKFVDERRERTKYNAAGLDTLSLTQSYDQQEAKFVNEQRIRQRYDAQNKLNFYLYQTWNNDSKVWGIESASQTANVYNATGGITKATNEQYDTVLKVFVPTQQTTYTLNARNEPTEIVNAVWNADAKTFENQLRSRNITWYNFAQDKPSYAETQEWDPATKDWLNLERSTGTYQSNGSNVIIVEEFVAASKVYQNKSRGTETYNDMGYNLLARYEEWNNGQWEITNETRSLIAYNADNQVRRLVSQQFDVTTKQYENLALTRYDDYRVITKTQPSAALAAATAVFPNPTSGNSVTVTLAGLPTSAPVPTELCNSLGQVVRTFTIQPRQGRIEQELDLSNLSAGLYILRLHAGAESISKRIVKQ